ncbi:MAG: ABC transporter permease, partial [Proteobacteria bacterium]|nr:ABC transporter permease [Pseudomonadota bacterium]
MSVETLPETPPDRSETEPARVAPRHALAFRWDKFSLATLGLLTIILLGLLAPLIAPHDPNATNLLQRSLPPGWYDAGTWVHPFGT